MSNQRLQQAMEEAGLRQTELADAVNDYVEQLTGRPGRTTDRTVRRWLTEAVVWPQERQRLALTAVLGRTPEELGFVPPPSKRHTAAPPEDPMQRRTFVASATVATAAVLTASAQPTATQGQWRSGATDVKRLRDQLQRLTCADQARGGMQFEQTAQAICHEATAAVNAGGCSQRVQRLFYAVAADAMAAAAWYALDGTRTASAARHLDTAIRLAELSHDPYALLHAWNSQTHHALTTGRRADALASAERLASLPTTRRDPLCRSLAHARIGTATALLADLRRSEAAFDRAHNILATAEDIPRPGWLGFFGAADLHSLNGKALRVLGKPQHAEAHAHAALSAVRSGYHRDHTLYHVHLAEAQLAQGEREAAADTIRRAAELASGLPGSARAQTAIDRLTKTMKAAR
ncbi:hypothetical protein ACFP1Z_10665 [Streptomyces gamaensis]|uniref:XRE family transcriptional regulator n=1 Tax=Streptomyces gamaensis TaxID=1763542 RepID=A0ABW0Z0Z4_9ACTN